MFPSIKDIKAALENEIVELEKLKLQTIRKCFICIGLIIVSLLLGLLLGIVSGVTVIQFCGFFIFFAGTIFSIVYAVKSLRNYRSTFKEQIVFGIVKQMIDNCQPPDATKAYEYKREYYPSQRISNSLIDRCGLFPMDVNRIIGEDLICGKIGFTDFYFSELQLFRQIDAPTHQDPNKKKIKKLFGGILFLADFNKHFKGRTYLRNRGMMSIGNNIKSWIGNLLDGQYLTTIKLENEEFNRYFKVSTSDEIEARYILSPQLMELLVEFRKRRRQPIDVSFFERYISLALTSKRDYFEPTLRESMEHTQVERVYKDLTLFFGMIEEFHLNRRIWSKYEKTESRKYKIPTK